MKAKDPVQHKIFKLDANIRQTRMNITYLENTINRRGGGKGIQEINGCRSQSSQSAVKANGKRTQTN